jgi:hypothetical protein
MAALTGKWISLAAIAVALSLLYVWQHVQLVRTGYTIKNMQNELARWEKMNEAVELLNERLKNPQRIEQALSRNNLGLVFPQGKNIVRLRYPGHPGTQHEGISGSSGGTDTLLSYASGGGGAGRSRI